MRDKGICQICRAPNSNEVDHIQPRYQGGTDAETNLRCVCNACHRAKSSSEGGRSAAQSFRR